MIKLNIESKYILVTTNHNKMSNQYLSEPHSFLVGDSVKVNHRDDETNFYRGIIYSIVNLPINKHLEQRDSKYTDYFYIRFPLTVYHEMILQGWEILYDYKQEVVSKVIRNNGQIESLYIRRGLMSEIEIDIKKVNAILIWRVGFEITKI